MKSFFLGTTFSTHFNHVPLRENNNQTQSFHGKEGKGITEILAYNSDASSNKGYGRVSQGLVILCVFVACASLFLFHTRQDLPCSNLNKEEVYIGKSTVKSQSKDQPFFSFNGNDQPLSSPHNDGIYIFITWDYWKKIRRDTELFDDCSMMKIVKTFYISKVLQRCIYILFIVN